MPKNQNRSPEDFSVYTAMSTEELEELLRLDSEAPAGNELDTDTILHILGVLAGRKKSVNSTGKTSQEAWESFQKYYLSDENDIPESTPAVIKPVKKLSPQIRRLIAVAAVIAILIFIPFTAKALGLWDYIAQWSKDTFQFVREDSPECPPPAVEHDMEYASLRDALIATDKDPSIVPAWFPEGYVLEDIEITENPIFQKYVAIYSNNKKSIHITLNYNDSTDATSMEISSDLVELYEFNDIEFYIFYNNDELMAAWIDGSGGYSISGDLTLKEMKEMINSIGKGE